MGTGIKGMRTGRAVRPPRGPPTFQSTESKLNKEPFCADGESQSLQNFLKLLEGKKHPRGFRRLDHAGVSQGVGLRSLSEESRTLRSGCIQASPVTPSLPLDT